MKTIILLCSIIALLAGPLVSGPLDGPEKLTLSVESVPLTKVLSMIAAQNGLNLVISDQVHGDVTVKLENVDLRTALDAILTANGYSYFLRDNVIVVKSTESAVAGELESRTVLLKYLDPVTAKKALDTRRSAKGQVIVLDRVADQGAKDDTYKANRILITDYASVIEHLVKLVTEMDIPERVILIDARILETTLTDTKKLGFAWPSSMSASITGLNDGSTSGGTGTTTSNTSMATHKLETGQWTWGTLSVAQVSLLLDMLNENGNSRLVSDPRISTVENNQAIIKITTVIPIQTINRFTEAAATQDIVSFQDEEIGITLKVTPRINENGKITMDVEPIVEDIIGYSGTAGNQKPIKASRSVKTRITVNDGETVALGGLVKEDNIVKIQKLPVLGSIPLLGRLLFSNSSKAKSTTDLIIMITPHIQP
jgi:type IV pilus secretin PilQ/predicted competence protein